MCSFCEVETKNDEKEDDRLEMGDVILGGTQAFLYNTKVLNPTLLIHMCLVVNGKCVFICSIELFLSNYIFKFFYYTIY